MLTVYAVPMSRVTGLAYGGGGESSSRAWRPIVSSGRLHNLTVEFVGSRR